MDEINYEIVEGKLVELREKAIKIDNQWFPISVLKYGVEEFWKIGDQIETEVAEWFLIENSII
jgi:hypothetical protein